jgi:cyclic dehypoxanthinyl futalosine synthase
VLGFEEIFRKIEETRALGGVQLLLQGGTIPTCRSAVVRGLFRAVKAEVPRLQAARAVAAGSRAHLADVEAGRARGDRSADRGRASTASRAAAPRFLVDRVRKLLNCYNKATASDGST